MTEVLTKMIDVGATAEEAMSDIEALGLNLTILDLDRKAAIATADLRSSTKHLVLSLGDRACLAAAQSSGLAVLTADRAWTKIQNSKIIAVR